MKNNSFIKGLLFVLTMVLLFAFAVQMHAKIWTFKPLEGVFEPTPEPQLNLRTFRTAQYQSQLEPYLKENIGFREPLIRFYNQYLYDFFKASTNESIVAGKDHWLYFKMNMNDYYGTEMYHWFDSKEKAWEVLDKKTRVMWKLRGILKDYDVDFLVFMAPEKGFVYPEYLPKRRFDTTTLNAREFFSAKFDAYGFPYIEMTQWFIDMKAADTLPYPLFPQTGIHWNFSSAYATDTLLRFMGNLKGIELPKLKFGPLHQSSEETAKSDLDCELIANLIRPLTTPNNTLYDADVTVVTNKSTTFPNVIFVGTSFLNRMYDFVPFDDLFSYSEFWYYYTTVRYGKKYEKTEPISDWDVLQKLIEADYVVFQMPGEQLYRGSLNFAESALLSLCFSEEFFNARCKQLMDSLNMTYDQVNSLIIKDPEHYFPELAGDSIPKARNPRIREALAIKEIKRDTAWMKNMQCQTVIRNATLEEVLKMEAQNILNNRPLMRDEPNVVSRQTYMDALVKAMEEDIIKNNPALLESIRKKAETNGYTFEQQLHADAQWIVNYRIEKGEIVF